MSNPQLPTGCLCRSHRKETIKIKIKLDEGAIMPTRAYGTDAGLDLYAREDQIVPAGGAAVFDTGVHLELPGKGAIILDTSKGEWMDVRTAGFLKSKSGLMVNHGITSDGTLDCGYIGSIHVKLFNHSTEDYLVKRKDKISQLVIVPVLTPELEAVDELDETERGSNGFGSTGR